MAAEVFLVTSSKMIGMWRLSVILAYVALVHFLKQPSVQVCDGKMGLWIKTRNSGKSPK